MKKFTWFWSTLGVEKDVLYENGENLPISKKDSFINKMQV